MNMKQCTYKDIYIRKGLNLMLNEWMKFGAYCVGRVI